MLQHFTHNVKVGLGRDEVQMRDVHFWFISSEDVVKFVNVPEEVFLFHL